MTVPEVGKVRYISTTWSKVLLAVSLLAIPVAIVWGIDKRPPPAQSRMDLVGLDHRAFRIIDGDTLALTIRLAEIDTPEMNGKCPAERELAKKAKQYVAETIKKGYGVTVQQTGVGKYGRMIARVTVWPDYKPPQTLEEMNAIDQPGIIDLSAALVAEGLARPWPPKPGETWCPTGSP